jgi:glycosyltransferase involved in cell wall biosynthesis
MRCAVRVVMLLHKSVVSDSRVRREAAALAQAGHEVIVLELAPVQPAPVSEPAPIVEPASVLEPARAPGAAPGAVDASVPEATLDGFKRRSALPPAWMRRRLPFHIYRAAFLVWFVAGIVRTRPQIVHAHDAAMLLPGVIGARLVGARLVYDSHELATSVPYRERAWALFVAGIERLVVPRCAAVITVSDGIAMQLRARYRLRRNPTVLRNVSALTANGTGNLRAHLNIDANTPLVLHQGAPAPARGCEVLVAALAQLPSVHLAFLGDPEPGYAQTLHAAIAAYGLGERVRLLPGVALADLLAHTAEADVGVTLLQDTCLNHRLALPNKLFEYIAAGVPVLAADLPETRRLVEDYGVGWCVQGDDATAVAAMLRSALAGARDAGLRERLARAAAELNWERERERLWELYDELSATERNNGRPAAQPGARQHGDRSATEHHETMAAQRRDSHERAVPAGPRTASQRRQERDGALRHDSEICAQPGAQLAHADQARMAAGSPNARLPNGDHATRGEHPAHLPERAAHIRARADGR